MYERARRPFSGKRYKNRQRGAHLVCTGGNDVSKCSSEPFDLSDWIRRNREARTRFFEKHECQSDLTEHNSTEFDFHKIIEIPISGSPIRVYAVLPKGLAVKCYSKVIVTRMKSTFWVNIQILEIHVVFTRATPYSYKSTFKTTWTGRFQLAT